MRYQLRRTMEAILVLALLPVFMAGIGSQAWAQTSPGFEWFVQFGAPTAGTASDIPRAVDADGNVYIVGDGNGAFPGQTSAGGLDVFVRKYDAVGGHVWTREFGTASDEFASGIAVDGAGGVYVVGSTFGTFPGQMTAGTIDAFVRKYDIAGNEVWTRQFGTGSVDIGTGVAVDSSGGVYIVGRTFGAFAGQSNAGLF